MAERRHWRGWRVVALLAVAAFLAYAYAILATWTDRPTIFVFVLAAFIALVALALWALDVVGPPVWRFVRSIAVSIGRAVQHDPEVDALLDRQPALGRWLRARLTLERWTGWYLTATLLLTAWFAVGFLSIAAGVIERGDLSVYDPGLAALVRAFRGGVVTRVMWISTVFGDPRTMWVVSVVFVLLLLVWGRRGQALLVAVTMSVGSLAGSFLKVVVARQRPSEAFALITTPRSASFPSGHATASAIFFTLLAFVLWRDIGTTWRRRFLIVLGCGMGALLVGTSRVYLGVHWPTDVVGGWYLGATIVTLGIGTFLMWERYAAGKRSWDPLWTPAARRVVTAVAIVVLVAAVVVGAQGDPLLQRLVQPPKPVAYASLTALQAAMPRFTEKLDGTPQEPVSLMFVGDRSALEDAFARGGWQLADQPSLARLAREVVAAASNEPDPTGPMTPAFLGGKANDLGFEESAGMRSIRRRHHARFWSTNATLDGKPVWLGTASLDTGLEIGPVIPLPTHHIDPDLDAERSYVASELAGSGLARELGMWQVTKPEAGTNAQGDRFFTDGRAVVLEAR